MKRALRMKNEAVLRTMKRFALRHNIKVPLRDGLLYILRVADDYHDG